MTKIERNKILEHVYFVLAETVLEMANNANDPDEEKVLVQEAEKLLRKSSKASA